MDQEILVVVLGRVETFERLDLGDDGVAEDLETMTQILEGKEWQELQEKLSGYVVNFKKKVVPYTGRFQL